MSPRTPEQKRAGRTRRETGGRIAVIAALLLVLASGAVAGEQWGWLGVRIRDLSEQEMEAQFIAKNRPTSLLRRLATSEEVANMVVYVCSPQASATTGAALRVDGGVVRSIA